MTTSKIRTADQLKTVADELRKQNLSVVQCDGAFDILHPGHLRHLTWAAAQGDVLIVAVTGDAAVRRTGSGPTLVPEAVRAENIAALQCVNYVIINNAESPEALLSLLKPDVYGKGQEFASVTDGAFARARVLVESYGGEVRFSSGEVVYSSEAQIDRLRHEVMPVSQQAEEFRTRHDITIDRLIKHLDALAGKNIVVIGEAIVDEYVHCDALGMSADTPTIVVRPSQTDRYLGGAGIVAQNIQAMGATAHFVTVLGHDAEADYVRAELEEKGVSSHLIVDKARPTILKKRFMADGRKLLNVNVFRDQALSPDIAKAAIDHLDRLCASADAVVVSDFSYGVVSQPILDTLAKIRSKRGLPVTGDVQSSSQIGRATRLKGITVTTPSEREARLATWDRESGLADVGVRLLEETRNEGLVITLGARGMMVLDTRGRPWEEIATTPYLHEIKRHLLIDYLPSFGRTVVDQMGAGDAVLSALSATLAVGGSLVEGAYMGACAGAVAVGRMGNVPVGREDLLRLLHDRRRG